MVQDTPTVCYNPLCEEPVSEHAEPDTEAYCSWECAEMPNKPTVCYNPLCEEPVSEHVEPDTEAYCSWECAEMPNKPTGLRRRCP